MIAVLQALVPVFLMIVLGHVLRRSDFPGDAFWRPAERLTYFVLFPALLVRNLAAAPFDQLAVAPIAGVLVTGILSVSLLAWPLRRLLGLSGPDFSSVYQGSIRFNTYLGLAACVALYGEPGLTVAAIAIAVMIPLINVLCVGVLSHFGPDGRTGWGRVLAAIVRNPLILACLTGLVLNGSGLGLPPLLGGFLEILGRASLPLGLLAVGAGLELRAAHGAAGVLAVTALLKLVVFPLIALGLALWLGLGPVPTGVVVLFGALPTATSAYILARQLGGNHRLMAAILTVQTAVSALTLPVVLGFVARVQA